MVLIKVLMVLINIVVINSWVIGITASYYLRHEFLHELITTYYNKRYY